MSRIHEALKKAEQERSVHQADQDGNGWRPLQAAATPESVSAAAIEAPAVPQAPSVAQIGAISAETISAYCQPRDWNPDPSVLVFIEGESHAAGKEVFRTLRTRLYQIRAAQPLKTIIVTSSLPGEGKTFVASNLAQSIVRQRERRLLLIDGDLRISRLHQPLGASSAPGLSDYLIGEADELAILQRGPEDNLYLIPGGKAVSNPTELLANGRLETLLSRLGPAFDWVLFDSPPVIPVSDATIIAKLCDGILFVVRAGATPFDLAQKACQEFQEKPVVGAVLNCADFREGYGGYDYGGYVADSRKVQKLT